MIYTEVIENAWYRNGYGHLLGPMINRYGLVKTTYQFTDGYKTYTKNGKLKYGAKTQHDLDIAHPLKSDGSPWEDTKKDAEKLIRLFDQFSREIGEKTGYYAMPVQMGKPMETKAENKMVSIELPEWYIKAIESNKEYIDKNIGALLNLFVEKCQEWRQANPEPKKMRAMTTEEKLKWIGENLNKVIGILTPVKQFDMDLEINRVKSFKIEKILSAEKYYTGTQYDKPNKFEVEVEE